MKRLVFVLVLLLTTVPAFADGSQLPPILPNGAKQATAVLWSVMLAVVSAAAR